MNINRIFKLSAHALTLCLFACVAGALDASRAAPQDELEGEVSGVIAAAAPGRRRAPRTPRIKGRITEFALPAASFPQLCVAQPQGDIWCALGLTNAIGRFTPAGASGRLRLRQYKVPTPNSFPIGIALGPDNNVWFTEKNGHRVGRLNTDSGQFTEYETPTRNSGPVGVTAGPDGAIWFTEAEAHKIGRLEPASGNITEYPTPTRESSPLYITNGPDGALWFVEQEGHKIGRIDPRTRRIVEYSTPTPASGPACIISGPDGALWFTELDGNKIGRFDPRTRRFTEYPLPPPNSGNTSGPGILIVGRDGAIWFTEMYGNNIGRLDPQTGEIHEFPSPSTAKTRQAGPPPQAGGPPAWQDDKRTRSMTAGGMDIDTGGPGSILIGPDGDIWYTQMFANKVAKLQIDAGR